MLACNLSDVLFCSWLCFACEQLCHLKVYNERFFLKINIYSIGSFVMKFKKGILKPLMELSASLDTYRPNSAALFRSLSANSGSELVKNDGKLLSHYYFNSYWYWQQPIRSYYMNEINFLMVLFCIQCRTRSRGKWQHIRTESWMGWHL